MRQEELLKELLLAADQEVHNHLRDTDQKRDHLLELYLKLVFALFSGAAGLEFLNVSWTVDALIIATLIFGIVLLFGETVYFAMVGARKWHAEYVNVHLLIHAALVRQDFSFSPELVPGERRYPFLPSLHTSRAFVLVQLCNASIVIMLAGGLWFNADNERSSGCRALFGQHSKGKQDTEKGRGRVLEATWEFLDNSRAGT